MISNCARDCSIFISVLIGHKNGFDMLRIVKQNMIGNGGSMACLKALL
jgi:hypothetical protein